MAVSPYSIDVGDGASTSLAVNHGMGTRDVQAEVYDNASPYATVVCDVERTTIDQVTLIFASAPSSNQYRVVVTG